MINTTTISHGIIIDVICIVHLLWFINSAIINFVMTQIYHARWHISKEYNLLNMPIPPVA